jgi:hypothetical protein
VRFFVRIAQIAVLAGFASFALNPSVNAAVSECATSQSACEECCNDSFQCCVHSGGLPTSDCDWEEGPEQNSCSVPGCMGGAEGCVLNLTLPTLSRNAAQGYYQAGGNRACEQTESG